MDYGAWPVPAEALHGPTTPQASYSLLLTLAPYAELIDLAKTNLVKEVITV